MGRSCRVGLSGLLALSALPNASAASISTSGEVTPNTVAPLLLALVIAYFVRRWFIPQQLKNLQVAFEIEDDLYEVHRITRTLRDSRRLLRAGRVGYGVLLYMMGLTGVLILISELLFEASMFAQFNLYIIATLILIPVLISPWESLNSQLSSRRRDVRSSVSGDFIRRITTLAFLLISTLLVLAYGYQLEGGTLTPTWLAFAMLMFMAPTIFAYGRIMGASWNMLLINKWRTTRGRPNPIDPDKNRFLGRLFSFLLVLFLLTMPITALNGILTVLYVMINNPANQAEVLNYGGIIGYSIFVRIDVISEILFHWEFVKSLPQFLSLYLTLNIAIVGLAFIFELTRNLILGGQTFGGMFGVTLDTPREIRAEKSAQARQLTFAFAGFSGYTVLLLILVCYKEFGSLMPLTATLEANGFDEGMRLLTVWLFIAVGQFIFLMTWLVSISRFQHLLNLRFDLNPDERREGAVLFREGINCKISSKTLHTTKTSTCSFAFKPTTSPAIKRSYGRSNPAQQCGKKPSVVCGRRPSRRAGSYWRKPVVITTKLACSSPPATWHCAGWTPHVKHCMDCSNPRGTTSRRFCRSFANGSIRGTER